MKLVFISFNDITSITDICAIEKCAGQILKLLLAEPLRRLPKYLRELGDVYMAWEYENKIDSEGAKKVLDAIVDIRNVSDKYKYKLIFYFFL